MAEEANIDKTPEEMRAILAALKYAGEMVEASTSDAGFTAIIGGTVLAGNISPLVNNHEDVAVALFTAGKMYMLLGAELSEVNDDLGHSAKTTGAELMYAAYMILQSTAAPEEEDGSPKE